MPEPIKSYSQYDFTATIDKKPIRPIKQADWLFTLLECLLEYYTLVGSIGANGAACGVTSFQQGFC
ncbi:hypothetical protein, partial [Conchiformibius steedae]|uniref:hypothetical protein n=1 Tax=Conchiformibius steedae TaxID=153493 RepID=UPI0026EB8037